MAKTPGMTLGLDLNFDTALAIGAAAGALQILGYAIYLVSTMRRRIEPNPVSWLMFAYGTALLALLEGTAGAPLPVMILPIVCAASGIIVALICWLRGKLLWPADRIEVFAFVDDLILTAGYVTCWLLVTFALISTLAAQQATAIFLVLSNATIITSFIPIIRSTWREPAREEWLPWAVWASAYLVLGAATMADETTRYNWLFYLYPVLAVVMCALIAVLTLRKRGLDPAINSPPPGSAHLYVDHTVRTGRGVFTRQQLKSGDLAFRLTGKLRRYAKRTLLDARRFPNWVGIGKDHWLEPDHPIKFLNHSCNPNIHLVSAPGGGSLSSDRSRRRTNDRLLRHRRRNAVVDGVPLRRLELPQDGSLYPFFARRNLSAVPTAYRPLLSAGLRKRTSPSSACWRARCCGMKRACKLVLRKSTIAGRGVHATQKIRAGEFIATSGGGVVRKTYRTPSDLRVGKTWISIGPDRWLVPVSQFKYVNHSCAPNIGFKTARRAYAMRDIGDGEEVTLDYSTVEYVDFWSMPCTCSSERCRQVVRSIQFLPAEVFRAYGLYIPPFFRRIYAAARR